MILRADARSIPLRSGSVQCVVTSPPYWGLRDYGISGQIGLEPTPEEWLATMVTVFREVRRVCRDDATVWCNLGDLHQDKQLAGMPWKLAFALQNDGWWLRSDIVWAKPNPMPESVTDRPTRSHEYIFLLAKSEHYFYDADAIREPQAESTLERFKSGVTRKQGPKRLAVPQGGRILANAGYNTSLAILPNGRNKRDVWTVNSEPTPEAHFATFPQALITPCILAGTSEKGRCAECGAPWARVTEVSYDNPGNRSTNGPRSLNNRDITAGFSVRLEKRVSTVGWRPSCSHDAPVVPCLVFDPFLGSGTVGKVCERLGRRWAGLELSEDYIAIARRRTTQMGLFNGPQISAT